MGWSTVTNGELLKLAEEHGYEVFVTTDQNLRYQQNLKGRKWGSLYWDPPPGRAFSSALPTLSWRLRTRGLVIM
jgi:hypothetical protein